MHIYAFGSVCRGDIDQHSDVDVLAICDDAKVELLPRSFASYPPEQMKAFWADGNAFAWHLARESRMLFSSDESDFLAQLGDPSPYIHSARDCARFQQVFRDAREAMERKSASIVFELSTVFLAIRNFATCYALGRGTLEFSRRSFSKLGEKSLRLSERTVSVIENARLLSVRGVGALPSQSDIDEAITACEIIDCWMNDRLMERE